MSNLEKLDFGLGAAQQERHLGSYFYRSGSFKLACSDKIYLILGAKGAGKSAIFKMLGELGSDIPIFAKPNLCVRDEPLLRDHYATLQTLPNASLSTLWRFYMASLIADRCLKEGDFPVELRKAYQRFLVRWGLVREVPTAWQAMKRMRVEVGFGDYFKTEFPPKVPIALTEIDHIIYTADEWLESQNRNLWLCLDSLDEASINGRQHDEIEDLLSNLMRAVAEVLRLRQIRFKLFFRSDIYHSLTYVNKDHFSALKLELQWSMTDLSILLGYRLRALHPENSVLNALKGPDPSESLTFSTSQQWIDEVFDWCQDGPPRNFDDLYSKLKDGNGVVLPRDIIKFCIEAQRAQINFDTQGIERPIEGKLISSRACSDAMLQTAASKLTDFLQVFQNFRDTYDLLKGSPSRHFTRSELSAALGKQDPLDADLVIADLVRVGAVGIKDKKSINQSNAFEIPYLYAEALEMGENNE